MKILVYEWRAYPYRDVLENFRALGAQIFFVEYKLEHYDEDAVFEALLERRIEETGCDFVFTMNYFAAIAAVCERLRVKYVAWTCDSPLISMYHETVFSEYNYIFTFDKTNYLEFLQMGVTHIFYLPLAVDTDRLDCMLSRVEQPAIETSCADQNVIKKTNADISFVGSLYERNTYDSLEKVLPDYLRGYFDACIRAQLAVTEGNIIEEMLTPDILSELQGYFKLEKSEGSFSDLGLIFQTTVLGFKVAAEQRRRALRALSGKFPVTAYSNSDFSTLKKVRALGSVDYWSQMPFVFHQSKINLNFTIPNIKSGIPLRVWDVLGCGGFLLTNRQAELAYYFEDGEDLVCFSDEADLMKKAEYYLTHEAERMQIAKNGYQKVKEEHTYRNRLEKIISIVMD